jgi:hypothetical protein
MQVYLSCMTLPSAPNANAARVNHLAVCYTSTHSDVKCLCAGTACTNLCNPTRALASNGFRRSRTLSHLPPWPGNRASLHAAWVTRDSGCGITFGGELNRVGRPFGARWLARKGLDPGDLNKVNTQNTSIIASSYWCGSTPVVALRNRTATTSGAPSPLVAHQTRNICRKGH